MNHFLKIKNNLISYLSSMREWPRKRKIIFILALIFVVICIILIRNHNANKTKRKNQAPAVVVATAKTKDVPITVPALGSVSPVITVTVRTQVNGILQRIYYQEGEMVKAGDLIAEIDSRPFLAQLKQYEGQLARDQALLENAKIDLERYKKLWSQDSVSQQTLATQQSLVRQLEGTVKLDEGLIESTQVNLSYCRITSPIDGRIGLKMVNIGNFVQTADTNGLVVITTVDPVNVVFSITEDDVAKVMKQLNAGKTLAVKAYNRTQNQLLGVGTLIAVDNQVDATTGTVRLKARFDNSERKFFPNQFVNVVLMVDLLKDATIIPTAAIQRGTQGTFVYMPSKDNNTVEVKPVITNVTVGDETAITFGVLPGQSVVVEGTDKLTNGSQIRIANQTT